MKQKIKKVILWLLCICMISAFIPEGIFFAEETVTITIVSGSDDGRTLVVGNTAILKVSDSSYRMSCPQSGILGIMSEDTENGTATVLAGSSGEATVYATNGTNTVSLKVYVVDAISVYPNTLSMKVGETYRLTTSATSTDSIEWYVENYDTEDKTAYVSVDSRGRVTAIAATLEEEPVKVIARQVVNNIVKTAVCTITVTNPVSALKLSSETMVLYTDGTTSFQLQATMTLSSGEVTYAEEVVWASSDEDIASVNSQGWVKLTEHTGADKYRTGVVSITAYSKDGNYTDSCVVTVRKRVTRVTLLEDTMEVDLNDKMVQMIATIYPDEESTNKELYWSSSNPDVATVDSSGMVTLLSSGETTITAASAENSSKAAQDSCIITVSIPVKGISLDKTSNILSVGEGFKLTHALNPTNPSNPKVEWTSTNPQVATVDNTGYVQAVAGGETTIIVKALDGSTEATCNVKVLQVVDSVKLNKSKLYLTVGETSYLDASIVPVTSTDKTVTWSSNKTDIATVSQDGKVEAKKEGIAVIKVKTTSNNQIATCLVQVSEPITSFTISKKKLTLYINDPEQNDFQLRTTIKPSNADQVIKWASTKSKVATVDDSGYIVAKKAGSTTISGKTQSQGLVRQCIVTVKEYVEKITLNRKKVTLKAGKKLQLKKSVANTTATNQKVRWSSSNTKVATVNSSGKITAKKKGTATITCTAEDGSGVKATCKVTVKKG